MAPIDPADHDEIRRDLATANRLIATMLDRFTEHTVLGDLPRVVAHTRSTWVEDETVAEWRAIAKAVSA